MGEWATATLGDLIELKRGYDLPQKSRQNGAVPIVSSSGVTDYHSVPTASAPGVVTGRYGTIGNVYYIDQDFWPLNTTLYVKDFKGNDPRFISYFLRGVDFLAYSDKAAVPGVNRNHLHSAQVRYPCDPQEQASIASTLGALDDKIELNRRMNETLEAMARATFRDWFVDFGPTRAKMEGSDPYLAPDLWRLFPDRLDDNGIPEGWTQGTLGDIAESATDVVDPADIDDVTPYFGLEHLPRRSVALSDWDYADKVTSNKSKFCAGDFLFGKLRPYFHKVGIAPVDGICSTDIVVVAPKAPHWAVATLACISSDEFVQYTDQTSTGTKMPRTSWSIMARYPLLVPSAPIAQALQELCAPMIERIVANVREAKTLASTRDLLLPKLMSGEITLKDAEQAAGGAA